MFEEKSEVKVLVDTIIGGNKTYTLMYEDNCPSQYRCVYNPGSVEPNIDDVLDSLNSIKK